MIEMTSKLIIVGSDRGGVGKTTIARALVDYFKHQGVTYRAFDTEAPLGVLKRFFHDNTQIVDLTRSGWPLGKDDCMHQRSLSYQVIP